MPVSSFIHLFIIRTADVGSYRSLNTTTMGCIKGRAFPRTSVNKVLPHCSGGDLAKSSGSVSEGLDHTKWVHLDIAGEADLVFSQTEVISVVVWKLRFHRIRGCASAELTA